MIDREDMLELTRRMTLKRNCFTRLAGAYMDEEGYMDGTFHTNFLKLSPGEQEKNMAIAKAIPFARENVNLEEYPFAAAQEGPGSMWRLLMELRDCELKNDALLEIFYEVAGERLEIKEPYAIYVFHGTYDVPRKGSDKERQWESEEVYRFLICAVCPLTGEYEPGEPMSGFLFPAFRNRSSDIHRALVFHRDGYRGQKNALLEILGLSENRA